MALTTLQRKKIQSLLIGVLGVVVLVTTIVLWWGFLRGAPAPATPPLPPAKRIEVGTSILSHPLLEILEEPRAKTQIPPNVGRDNPLLPL